MSISLMLWLFHSCWAQVLISSNIFHHTHAAHSPINHDAMTHDPLYIVICVNPSHLLVRWLIPYGSYIIHDQHHAHVHVVIPYYYLLVFTKRLTPSFQTYDIVLVLCYASISSIFPSHISIYYLALIIILFLFLSCPPFIHLPSSSYASTLCPKPSANEAFHWLLLRWLIALNPFHLTSGFPFWK